MVGGAHGGSGLYVYQLGAEGWKLYFEGQRYRKARAVNYHTLAIADVFVNLKRAEREGWLKVKGISTEPDSWQRIGSVELKPDLLVEIERLDQTRTYALWLEIDLGTESQKQLREKLERYATAYKHADEGDMPVWPLVLFLTPDVERRDEIRWLIGREPADQRDMFKAVEAAHFPDALR